MLYPDWMWMYQADSKTVSYLVVGLLIIPLYFLPFVAGFFLSRAVKNRKAWIIVLCIVVAAQIAEFIILLEPYNTVTSFNDYHDGKRVHITITSLVYILTGLSFDVILVSLVLFVIGLKKSKSEKQNPTLPENS